ncbi:MAG: ribbon-helix-helix protein, CopG family [Anaerolineae bacterium]|nr:ribbon-helix-helix protein, CopG family [Anaerolineae bacterium]
MQKSIPSIKTAISLKKPLYQQIDQLAREMKLPRSQVFVLALEDYLERHQNRALLNAINEAYAEEVNDPDAKQVAARRQSHRKIVEGEW